MKDLHTKQLEKRYKDKKETLDQEKQRKELRKQRNKGYRKFKEAKDEVRIEFFCISCQLEFKARAKKYWNDTYGLGSRHARCPKCDRTCVRYINDSPFDPYYSHSPRVRAMRAENYKDTLQPDDFGFKMLYGDPFNE